MKIEKNDDFGGAILNCAVRYALGRVSYMPGLVMLVMDEIRPMLENLTSKTLYCMDRDIREWMSDAGNQKNPYWEDWGGFLKLVKEQLKKRKTDATPEEDERIDFMIFSQRIALTRVFEKWADENGVAKTPASVVAFLYGHGMLDVQKAFRIIEQYGEDKV